MLRNNASIHARVQESTKKVPFVRLCVAFI
jgi:hypothetical protein